MKTLVIITGPTGSGKTDLAIDLAESLDTEIVSADSRQIYCGIPIGTAVPTIEQRGRVKHHFIEMLNLSDYYSAAIYEQEALETLERIWKTHDYAIMCGGSMMYIDAVTKGIDQLPTITNEIRQKALAIYTQGGLTALWDTLQKLDPDYLKQCDRYNHRRLVHAIEISLQAGVPYTTLRSGCVKERPFRIIKFAINHSRENLFARINQRVENMIEAGFEKEAESVYHLRHLNSLNTVGYKELFAMMDGVMSRDTAIARIAKNTRVYAKKQLLWLSKDPTVHLITPELPMLSQVLNIIQKQ